MMFRALAGSCALLSVPTHNQLDGQECQGGLSRELVKRSAIGRLTRGCTKLSFKGRIQ